MPDQDLKNKVRRVRKEGRLKVQSKAEALELITYAKSCMATNFESKATQVSTT